MNYDDLKPSPPISEIEFLHIACKQMELVDRFLKKVIDVENTLILYQCQLQNQNKELEDLWSSFKGLVQYINSEEYKHTIYTDKKKNIEYK